eukprot:1103776-Amphidinium_carterae.1
MFIISCQQLLYPSCIEEQEELGLNGTVALCFGPLWVLTACKDVNGAQDTLMPSFGFGCMGLTVSSGW